MRGCILYTYDINSFYYLISVVMKACNISDCGQRGIFSSTHQADDGKYYKVNTGTKTGLWTANEKFVEYPIVRYLADATWSKRLFFLAFVLYYNTKLILIIYPSGFSLAKVSRIRTQIRDARDFAFIPNEIYTESTKRTDNHVGPSTTSRKRLAPVKSIGMSNGNNKHTINGKRAKNSSKLQDGDDGSNVSGKY